MRQAGEPAWLVAAQGAAEEQRRSYIGGRDPEDRHLQMPGAHQIARKNALQIEAIKAARIGTIMSNCAAHQRLRQQQQRHDHEEFHQRVLAPAGLPRQQVRVEVMAARDPAQVIELAKGQQYRRNAGQQHA